MLRVLLLAALLVSPCRPECVIVEGDHINAVDLAHFYPEFASLPAGVPVAFSPAAGHRHSISAQEVSSWAAQNHLRISSAASPVDACFERFSQVLTSEDVEPLLRSALGNDNDRLEVEVVELSRSPLPAGRLQFQPDGATPPPPDHPDAPFLWRGTLTTGDGRVYPLWARVRVLTSGRAVRAKLDLPVGHVISEGELEEFETRVCPLSPHVSMDVDYFRDHVMRRSVRAGTMLKPSMVEDLSPVSKGTLVTVRVNSGSANLSFKAMADINGRIGQRISLTNLDSHRHFAGTVLRDGTVSLDLSLETSRNEQPRLENNRATVHTTSKTTI